MSLWCLSLFLVFVQGCATTKHALRDDLERSSFNWRAGDLRGVTTLSCIPVGTQLLFTALGLAWKPKKAVVRALQHLTAGVIAAAVVVELVPLALQTFRGTIMDFFALVLGFLVAIVGLSFLSHVLPEQCLDCESESENASLERNAEPEECCDNKFGGLKERTSSLRKRLSTHTQDLTTRTGSLEAETLVDVSAGPKQALFFWKLPWVLLAPLAVNMFLDGLLLALALVARSNAGYVVSVGFAIEAGIIGCTTSATLKQKHYSPTLVLSVSAVFGILFYLGEVVGSIAFSFMTSGHFLALLSFGMGALLYLAIDVLLVEARENLPANSFLTKLSFYVGFLAVLLVHVLLE